jgi:hypothetical protein
LDKIILSVIFIKPEIRLDPTLKFIVKDKKKGEHVKKSIKGENKKIVD